MAITNVAVSWQGGVPAANGQVVADRASAGKAAQNLYGTASFVLDGAATTTTLCYIDAPNANNQISFAPSGIICTRSGGNALATVSVVSCVDSGNKNSATVKISAADANNNIVNVSLILIP